MARSLDWPKEVQGKGASTDTPLSVPGSTLGCPGILILLASFHRWEKQSSSKAFPSPERMVAESQDLRDSGRV